VGLRELDDWNMRICLLAVSLTLLVPMTQAGAETFLCVGELATGLEWSGSAWQVGPMDASRHIFVVQPSGTLDDYTVTRIGDAAPSHYCPVLRRPDSSLLLFCGGIGNGFSFSSRTLRFQENYGIGYTNAADSNANRPYLLAGKCTRLELRGLNP
jgi:hypothetical protein